MGSGYVIKCKECGFSYDVSIGIGFLYSDVCDKILEDMKNGKFGEDFKESANTITNPAIHQSDELFVCDNCGFWRASEIIDLCSPIETKKKKKCLFWIKDILNDEPKEITSYVMTAQIGRTHQIVRSVEHKCDCCRTNMHPIEESNIRRFNLRCPKCHEQLLISFPYDWD